MGVESWYTDAGTNSPVEGVLPSAINDEMRAMKADTRAAFNGLFWWQLGVGNGPTTWTYVNGTSVKTAADVLTSHHAGRRVKLTGTNTGTIYGVIASAGYSGGFTTLQFTLDSGAVASDANLAVWLGIEATNSPLPRSASSTFGVIKTAGSADVQTGSATDTAVTPAALGGLLTKSSAGTIVFAGGLRMSWGTAIAGSDGLASVTFSPAFASTPYFACANSLTTAPTTAQVAAYSTTTLIIFHYTAATGTAASSTNLRWLAVGAA
jgi:hypothetical protein